jgi:putative spermidine/putrescine transport system permease protein
MRRIYLPLTLPGVLSGATLVFVISLGFFITPALLGGGRVLMIGVLIEKQVRQYLDWGLAAALAIIVLAVALAIYAALRRVLKDDLQWS